MHPFMVAALVAFGVGWAGCAAAEVGMRRLAYADPVSGGAGALNLWYPASAPERPVRRGPFTLTVAEDAPLAGGPYPLVIISHGSGGGALNHADTAMALVRRGYVVAAVHHHGNAAGDDGNAGTERMWRGRPAQLSAALDAVLSELAAGGKAGAGAGVDAGRIGALGFSAGAYTVLVAAGGVADLGRIATYCRTRSRGEGFCRLGRDPMSGAVAAPDARIRAAVLMAPVGAPFGAGGLAKVSIPIRLYRAERDEEVAAAQVEGVRDLLPVPPEYEVVPNAGHFSFMIPLPPAAAAGMGPPARDPPGFDRAAFHERLNAEVADFFDRALAIRGEGR